MRNLTSCHFGAAICTTIINLIVNAMSVLARLFVLAAMLAATGPVYAQQGDAKRPAATGRVAIGPNPDCGIPIVTNPVAARRAVAALGSTRECAPPYQTPAFTKPADDSIVFGSLLEAAGVSVMGGKDSVAVAAGNFCGPEKELILANNVNPVLYKLSGPTPNSPVQLYGNLLSFGPWRALAAGKFNGSNLDALVAIRSATDTLPADLVVAAAGPSCDSWGSVALRTGGHWVAAAVGNFQDAVPLTTHPVAGLDATVNVRGAAVPRKNLIALLQPTQPQLALFQFDGIALSMVFSQNLDGDLSHPSDWKVLAAGDIDGDGKDELIVARKVNDGQTPTVLALKWDAASATFNLIAFSMIGNDGNSGWMSMTAGDFNADGRLAVALVKNQHPNFVLLDLPKSSSGLVIRDPNLPPSVPELRTLATSDLDSADGQNWTGLAATDWLGGDQGADELIAVRAVHAPYRTNVFVYGNPIHRASRDTGLEGTKAQYDQNLAPNGAYFMPSANDLKQWIRGTHTSVFNWYLGVFQEENGVHDFSALVDFLTQTKNWGVDGKQLRVWVTMPRPGSEVISENGTTTLLNLAKGIKPPPDFATRPLKPTDLAFEYCAVPEDTSDPTNPNGRETNFNPLDFFKQDFQHDFQHLTVDDAILACNDLPAWASLIGRLAQDFPHLVAFAIDDFSDGLETANAPNSGDCTSFDQDCIAQIETRLRSQAPWLNFVPTIYHDYYQLRMGAKNWADLGLTLDSMLFYFRNEEHNECMDLSPECAMTANNAPDEIRDMKELLPSGRKLQVGVYLGACCTDGARTLKDWDKPPAIRYDYDLLRLAQNMPEVGGTTAYTMQTPPWISTGTDSNISWQPCSGSQCVFPCTETNFLQSDFPGDLKDAPFGLPGTDRFCALWKAYGEKRLAVTDTDLTQTLCNATPPCPLPAVGNPFGYVSQGPAPPPSVRELARRAPNDLPQISVQNVAYRATDNHIHLISRASSDWRSRDLSGAAGTANAAGDPNAYVFQAQSLQNVVYRGTDDHIYRLFWATDPPATGEDLTEHARMLDPNHVGNAAGDPFGYVIPFQSVQNVVYPGSDGVLHGLWWLTGEDPIHNDLLTKLANAPSPVGSATAYVSIAQGLQNVVYTGSDGHLHRLTWAAGAVTQEDLTQKFATPNPAGTVAAYFNEAGGMQHIFSRDADQYIFCHHRADKDHPDQDHPLQCSEKGGDVFEMWGSADFTGAGAISGMPINAPLAQSNPSAYFVAADGTNHLFYNYMGYIHELWWQEGTGGANHNVLTTSAGAPLAASDPSAYFDAANNMHHVIYRSADGHLHDLQSRN